MAAGKSEVKREIDRFIRSNGIMTLATSDGKRPWVCTVYYGTDKELNLYIVTDPRSRHARYFAKSPAVAFNIFDSHQKITKPKKGVQGTGTIELVKGLLAVTRGLMLWHKANPGIERSITVRDIFKKLTDTKVYRIRAKYLKFFNQELHPKEEYAVWER